MPKILCEKKNYLTSLKELHWIIYFIVFLCCWKKVYLHFSYRM